MECFNRDKKRDWPSKIRVSNLIGFAAFGANRFGNIRMTIFGAFFPAMSPLSCVVFVGNNSSYLIEKLSRVQIYAMYYARNVATENFDTYASRAVKIVGCNFRSKKRDLKKSPSTSRI